MCSSLKNLICVHIFRCTKCNSSTQDLTEKCSYSPNSSPNIWSQKKRKKSNSYELFANSVGSNRTSEINCKMYSEDHEVLLKGKTNLEFSSAERNGDYSSSQTTGKSSQTPEYVKRTAKLFETVNITTSEIETGNGMVTKKCESEIRETYVNDNVKPDRKISLDSLDGDSTKKPSYLGVSCSNSGYRNVINYDSKLREGFWNANSQRESLVLCSSRLRESSPLRRDFDFKAQNGTDPPKITNIHIEREQTAPVNGVSQSFTQSEKFFSISTSTKTISTFRNSKDIKTTELDNNVNGVNNHEPKSNTNSKVNLKQILNGRNEETYRKGYSNLGFSPKILKSPEKNCNSFLKSINSFENNCKQSQTVRSTTYTRTEQTICSDSSNSIQQRIERLYGPGALAQKFYVQKSNSKTKLFEKPEEVSSERNVEVVLQPNVNQPQTTVNNFTSSITNNVSKAIPVEIVPTEPTSNGHLIEETSTEDAETEKNGLYFLKLLKKETDRLERLASFAESELENGENIPEEISGKLRAAAGKARLLVCQKLHQFEGLCQKNMNEKPGEQFPTTSEDLAGFWDMVMLQVVQVYGVFDELEELKKNNWNVTPAKKETGSPAVGNKQSPSTKTPTKKSTPNSSMTEEQSQKSEAMKKAREEARKKLLEERRKKMKELKENKVRNKDNEVEIFAK